MVCERTLGLELTVSLSAALGDKRSNESKKYEVQVLAGKKRVVFALDDDTAAEPQNSKQRRCGG